MILMIIMIIMIRRRRRIVCWPFLGSGRLSTAGGGTEAKVAEAT